MKDSSRSSSIIWSHASDLPPRWEVFEQNQQECESSLSSGSNDGSAEFSQRHHHDYHHQKQHPYDPHYHLQDKLIHGALQKMKRERTWMQRLSLSKDFLFFNNNNIEYDNTKKNNHGWGEAADVAGGSWGEDLNMLLARTTTTLHQNSKQQQQQQ